MASIHLLAVGGMGASSVGDVAPGTPGGHGGIVSGDLPVSAGSTLYAVVGANGGGQTPGGAGGGSGGFIAAVGGGGGGGASDVRSSQDDLASRLLVAGGGGGGGCCFFPAVMPVGGAGGAGGGHDGTGVDGGVGGGGAGGSTSGGVGGAAGGGSTCGPPFVCVGAGDGGNGGSGFGGDGGQPGFGFIPCFPPGFCQPQGGFFGGGGGGGGGGLFGGGGGGGSLGPGGGGGGGGSNLVPSGASQSVDTTGVPEVVISYGLHPAATTVGCSPGTVVAGRSTTCTATVTDTASADQTAPTGTVALTTGGPGSFTAGGECTLAPAGGGSASCVVQYTPTSTTSNPDRSDEITAAYGGDDTHTTGRATTQETVISPTALVSGSFAIGDQNVAAGTAVSFWGAQWSALNSPSGGPAPASFKGFAADIPTNPPQCGDQWTTTTGNSSVPPATVPQYMELAVASHVTQRGSTISGNTQHAIVVKTNPGYGPSPSQLGTGTVVAQAC